MNMTPGSCPAEKTDQYRPLYIATEIIIAVLAITGNLLVCLAVAHNKKLCTVTNYFLVRQKFNLKHLIPIMSVHSLCIVYEGVVGSGGHTGGTGGHSLCGADRPGSAS